MAQEQQLRVRCPRCGSPDMWRIARRWFDYAAALFQFSPVRCVTCGKRSYFPLSAQVGEKRSSATAGNPPPPGPR